MKPAPEPRLLALLPVSYQGGRPSYRVTDLDSGDILAAETTSPVPDAARELHRRGHPEGTPLAFYPQGKREALWIVHLGALTRKVSAVAETTIGEALAPEA
jgi:hypothetical protein